MRPKKIPSAQLRRRAKLVEKIQETAARLRKKFGEKKEPAPAPGMEKKPFAPFQEGEFQSYNSHGKPTQIGRKRRKLDRGI
ncbi:MAG: hypothetical protein NUV67_05220 [archaeon]|nr:hypothetical protein [archaeon]